MSFKMALLLVAMTACLLSTVVAHDHPSPKGGEVSVEAARREAEGCHAVIEEMLHAVHARYYRENERMPLPAAVFRESFGALEKRRGVSFRWLAVEGVAMNTDHQPRDDFERDAVEAIRTGNPAIERVDHGVYRRAGAIALTGHCLKCHVPDRKSLEDRSAGLVIAVPLHADVSRGGSPSR